MIQITKITSDLAIYHENKVFLWDTTDSALDCLALLKAQGIHPKGFCSPSPQVRHFHFLPVLSLDELQAQGEHTLLQLTLPEEQEEFLLFQELFPVLEPKNQTILRYGELQGILPFLLDLDREQQNLVTPSQSALLLEHRTLTERMKALEFFHKQHKEALFLCLPPKTGDHSLIKTFQKHQIPHHFVFHNPSFFDPTLFLNQGKQIKVITAVRDPISQLISLMYQILGDINHSLTARFLMYGRFNRDFFRHGGDAQEFFLLLLEQWKQGDPLQIGELASFFQRFEETICPIPSFDVERGYSIYTQGDVQVFVYQLEKLDQIVPSLASFVGGDFHTLERGNEADKKWIASSYRNAKKELVIPADFKADCYQSSWYKKFYAHRQG